MIGAKIIAAIWSLMIVLPGVVAAIERQPSTLGVRWHEERDIALDTVRPRQSTAPSPLRSAAALQSRDQPVSKTTTLRHRSSRARKLSKLRRPDVIYYPTPDETAAEMLRLATIKQGDVLYDLGSGDGRIPILAAQRYGIRAVGIEIDPKLVAIAQDRARQAQVENLVSFRNADMFRTDISEATVVTLYLSNKINLLLRPKLLAQLRPGSRIISHDFRMGDWPPEQIVKVPWQSNLYRTVYLWTVPSRDQRTKIKKPKVSFNATPSQQPNLRTLSKFSNEPEKPYCSPIC